MAETFTNDLSLSKFAQGEVPPVLSAAKLNANWDKVDAAVIGHGNAFPASYQVGKYFFRADQGLLHENTGTLNAPVWTARPLTGKAHAATHGPLGNDPLNGGRGWQFYGSLEGAENAPWWVERFATTYTFIDLDIDELPVGSDAVFDIIKRSGGIDSTVATISISPSEVGKYVSDDEINFSTVPGDKLRAVPTLIGSAVPGSSATVRIYPS